MFNKLHLSLFIFFISLTCHGQINFESGYYITNSNERMDCLIKNVDWKNNPTQIYYRLSESDKINIAAIQNIKEFGIGDVIKFVRSSVNIDKSDKNVQNLSNNKNPEFKRETLYLKVLVEGKASLYSYESDKVIRYFYQNDDAPIEQLVQKLFLTADNKIGENSLFRNQLWNNLKCPNFKISKAENLKYQKTPLVDYFIAYNECKNSKFTSFKKKRNRGSLHLSLRPGFKNTSLSAAEVFNAFNRRDLDFENQNGFRFGIDAEFILPFNKNKWGIFVEPTYQFYKAEAPNQDATIDYKSIELPLGLRHYFFLTDNFKVFLSGSILFDLPSRNSEIIIGDTRVLELKTRNNYALGFGAKLNDTFSIEVQYQTARDVLYRYPFWYTKYNSLSVIIGYQLF